MALKAGIVGLPNVGKSTLFSAITNSRVEIANYPFATIEPNVGIVELKDQRLVELAKIVNPKKIVNATFEFIDIAGLVEGASQGAGLGNKFLANIREVDAIIQVVRCFDDPDIIHSSSQVDPLFDIEIINLELMLADLETVNNVYNRISRKATATNDKNLLQEIAIVKKLQVALADHIPVRNLELSEKELVSVKNYQLLTLKPVLYVGNIDESFLGKIDQSFHFNQVLDYATKNGALAIAICAKAEQDLSELELVDREIFFQELKIVESGLTRLIRESFHLLKLATYFTAGPLEAKAWTFKVGMSAPECAGIIHSDFERGFIRAEIISYHDYVTNQGVTGAKEVGKVRLEGKQYLMQDGDVVNFRFNV